MDLLILNMISHFVSFFRNDVKDAIVDPDNNNQFKNAYGSLPFQYMEKNHGLNDLFNKAMAGASTLELNQILKIYKGFEGVSTLVDVGGGVGQALEQILSQYPSIKGINFDLPQVIQTAPPHPGNIHHSLFLFRTNNIVYKMDLLIKISFGQN